MIYLTEWRYDREKQCDVARRHPISFDPTKYKTKKGAAKGLARALRIWARNHGYSADEIDCWEPARTVQYSGSREWSVVWESGPHDWAIAMSMEISGPWGYSEPYHGFDLHFTE